VDRLTISIVVLSLYLLLGTLLAVYSRKRSTGRLEDFYIGEGRLGGFLSAMTYAATTYSSFMIVGLVGLAYLTGVGALGFELVYLVGTLGLLTLLAVRAWRLARERGWVTPSQMLGDAYSSRLLASGIALLYLFALIPYASSQVIGIGETFAGLAGEEYYVLGVLFALLVMLVWSSIAGIWSVAVTDALQGLWMLASATLLLAWLALTLHQNGVGIAEVEAVLSATGLGMVGGKYWPPHVFLAFTLPWLFFATTNPQVVQRLFMPRDPKSLRSMIRWFGVFGLYYTVVVTLLGIGVEYGILPLSVESGDQVTPQLLALAHPLLSALVFTSIVAASVSTADSILLTLSSTTSYDLVRDPAKRRRAALASIVLVALVMAAIALARGGTIVDLSVLSSLILLSLAPPTIAAWLGLRGDARLAAMAVATGPLLVIVELIRQDLNARAVLTASYLGVPVSAYILVLSTLLTIAGVAGRGALQDRRGRQGNGAPKSEA